MQDIEPCRKMSLVVGDKYGSRDVGYPIPKVGLLRVQPAVSGGREKMQREELRCKMENDAAEGPVVKTMRVLLAPCLGKGRDHLTAGLCTFRVVDRVKGEVRFPCSRAHSHLEWHLEDRMDCACMERATEDRESSISEDRFLKDRRLAAQSKKCEGTSTDGPLVSLRIR